METLRSVVQPITRNLPAPVRDLGVSVIGSRCYKTLLVDVEPEPDCLRLAASKGLGIGIVAASSVVKVPQMVKLAGSRSAEGVSFLSYLLETSAYLITLAYNVRNGFPFSTYGETALILGQNVVICVLVLNYGGRAALAAVFVAALAGSVAALFAPQVVDMQALSYLQAGAGLLGVASKVPQIVAIWSQGGTGQLSAFAVCPLLLTASPLSPPPHPFHVSPLTCSLSLSGGQVFNYLAGSLSRIFTTLQEVDDKLILYGFISGFCLNLVLALQMIYYWNAPSEKAKGKRKAAPVASAPAPAAKSSPSSKKAPTTRRRG